jgi:hypothetical protein
MLDPAFVKPKRKIQNLPPIFADTQRQPEFVTNIGLKTIRTYKTGRSSIL